MTATQGAELSRIVVLDRLPAGGSTVAVRAEPDELSAVRRRLDLLALDRLEAELTVTPEVVEGDRRVRVLGRLTADVAQRCVVTLEPVRASVDAAVERLFGTAADGESETLVDPDLPDVEPLEGDRLDLGEIVVEELSLALDPFPRAADADAYLAQVAESDGQGPTGPFAALGRLRRA